MTLTNPGCRREQLRVNGGTELAPMSATYDENVAVGFSTGGRQAVVLRLCAAHPII